MSDDISNPKVSIITGASSGIGRATAKLLSSKGVSVVLASRREQELQVLTDEIRALDGSAFFLAGDIRDESYVQELTDFALSQFGRIDIAINNAGALGKLGGTSEMRLCDWQETLDTNLTSAFLCAKYQLPSLQETQGALIFTSSFVGYTAGMPGMSAYAASKAGLLGLTKCLAAEYGKNGVRVNAILPGGTDTPMASEAVSSEQESNHVEQMHALNRLAQPNEIAEAISFLASDAASFITGSAMLADGGVSIHRA